MHEYQNIPEGMDLMNQEAIYFARTKLEKLSEREILVLHYLISGIPTKLIAYKLGITSKTIQKHRCNIMRKTETRSISVLTFMFYQGIKNCSSICLLIRLCIVGDPKCPIYECLSVRK